MVLYPDFQHFYELPRKWLLVELSIRPLLKHRCSVLWYARPEDAVPEYGYAEINRDCDPHSSRHYLPLDRGAPYFSNQHPLFRNQGAVFAPLQKERRLKLMLTISARLRCFHSPNTARRYRQWE